MALYSFLLALFLLIPVFIGYAHGLKCYSYMCSNATMGMPKCAPPKVVTCRKDPASPVHPDRCITQRIRAEPMKGVVIHREYRGCSHYLECELPSLCRGASDHEGQCDVSCCQGDLCNDGRPADPGPRLARQTGPTGSALACYACSNATQPGEHPSIPCDKPVKQTCGNDPLTNLPQDRCLTIVMETKVPGSGHVMHQEMRNCSAEHYCNDMICANANMSGLLTKCSVSCCHGNGCNNEGLAIPTSTVVPSSASEEGDKYARAGKPSPPPVITAVKPTLTSGGSRVSMHEALSVISVMIIIQLYFANI
ncbi:uncharacterized protein LOC116618242 [Nematostella vectensis]|uniref:uncharacterized protein LOC116618242 n=1 Tax=Nematostella vectensis TaxID=45351 RepID=UPI0013904BDD|nr:uncharacterized protein LOC116618242 [Nematostella vectensis]